MVRSPATAPPGTHPRPTPAAVGRKRARYGGGPPRRRGGLGSLSGDGVNLMMPLETQVCSRELAQRLAELGERQESVFWWVERKLTYTGGLASQAQLRGAISAFTVAELGEMLPNEINIPSQHGKPRSYNHWLRFGRYRVSVNAFWCAYPGGTARTNLEERANTEADARAKMLIYLLENNLISHANP
jgi:hypothetical protein